MRPRMLVSLAKETFTEWQEDRAERLAAALAYYAVFSLGPLLLIIIAVAGLAFGEEAARGQIVTQLTDLVGREGAEIVEMAIKNASEPSSGIVATIIGVVLLVMSASGLFGQLQDALNTIWEVPPRPDEGITGVVVKRLLSMAMVFGIGFMLLISLALSAALAALSAWVGAQAPGGLLFWQGVNQIVSLAITTLLFAMMFKILPDTDIAWRDVWIGALLTAVLFTVGKFLIGLYLGQASVGSAYGAAGSLLVVLVWIYYSAQLLFLGAEFTQVYARRHGSRAERPASAEPSRLLPIEPTPAGQSADTEATPHATANRVPLIGGDISIGDAPPSYALPKPDLIVIGTLLVTTVVAARRLLACGRQARATR